jgi:hypothetical protein
VTGKPGKEAKAHLEWPCHCMLVRVVNGLLESDTTRDLS